MDMPKHLTKIFKISLQAEIPNHEKNCVFRLITCPRPDCEETFRYSDVKQHFFGHSDHTIIQIGSMTMKKDVLPIRRDQSFSRDGLQVPPLELELNENVFLFMVYRDHARKLWYFYISFIGSKANSEKYKSIVAISSQNDVS